MPKNSLVQSSRTFLFVPGDRPDQFQSAESSGSDVVVFDLEDAVLSGNKEFARQQVLEHLTRKDSGGTFCIPAAVRINSPISVEGQRDLECVKQLPENVAIVVAKADRKSLSVLRTTAIRKLSILPLVETARGIEEVNFLAEFPGVLRLLFGHLDLCAELGIDSNDNEALHSIRIRLRTASAVAKIAAPVDGVATDFRNDDHVRSSVASALRAGFTGKLCIHPSQIDAVHKALRPSAREIAWARKVLEEAQTTGVSEIDGVMVDKPIRLRAESIMRRISENDVSN